MNIETFKKLIACYQVQEEHLDELKKLGFDIRQTHVVDFGRRMFDYILQTNFDSDGQDIIYRYLTEKKKYPDLEMFNDKHNIIPTKSIGDLWNVVKNYMI